MGKLSIGQTLADRSECSCYLLRMEAELLRRSIGYYMVRFRVRMSSYLVMGTLA